MCRVLPTMPKQCSSRSEWFLTTFQIHHHSGHTFDCNHLFTTSSSTDNYSPSPCQDKIKSLPNFYAPSMQMETRPVTPPARSSAPIQPVSFPAIIQNPSRRFSAMLLAYWGGHDPTANSFLMDKQVRVQDRNLHEQPSSQQWTTLFAILNGGINGHLFTQ